MAESSEVGECPWKAETTAQDQSLGDMGRGHPHQTCAMQEVCTKYSGSFLIFKEQT